MKKVILLVLLIPYPVFAQIVFDFEQGSLSGWIAGTEERWKADTTGSLSGIYSLHHVYDNPDAGTDCIALLLGGFYPGEGDASWSFVLKYGYDPSSANNWSVFLMSDAGPSGMADIKKINGFALGVNLSGSDDTLRLVKLKEGSLINVVTCGLNWQNDVGPDLPVRLDVLRTIDGVWSVRVYGLSGNLISTASGSDKELFTPLCFGLRYMYTSTRDRLLWFDDLKINGTFRVDTVPPQLLECVVSGRNSVDILLNEEPSDQSTRPANFSLESEQNLLQLVTSLTGRSFRISFSGTFENKKSYGLIISSLCDKSGNCAENVKVRFVPSWPEAGDVIISEIMADPSPQVSLPQKQYVEIFNRSTFPFNLGKWKLSAGESSAALPDAVIHPSEYMILCSLYDTSLFSVYGKTIGLKSFPYLAIGGSIVSLDDSSANLIHGLEYSSKWYGNELKSEGGWSLEMKDPGFPFYYDGNWTASTSRNGGTPGSANSVMAGNKDTYFYGIENVFPNDSLNVVLTFSEPVFDTTALKKNLKIDGKPITSVNIADKLMCKFIVSLADYLEHHRIYKAELSEGIKDFAGNAGQNGAFNFGLAESSRTGDILFNELLFNPLPGDADYLELYNSSDRIVDVSRLQLVSVNDQTGDTSSLVTASAVRRCFLPGTYYAITTEKKKITDRYFSSEPKSLFNMASLPSMSDDKGHIILYNKELDVIDQVRYDEKMQYSLLSSFEGVSLEKSFPSGSSGDAVNWHSASESSGWGTPGAQNSVYSEFPETSDMVVFSSSKITPDGDGNEDFLEIGLKLEGDGNIVTALVFDETGSPVKKIASNLLAGNEARLLWDATADDGSAVNTGIYVLLINLYDDKGKTKHWKRVCTVIRR